MSKNDLEKQGFNLAFSFALTLPYFTIFEPARNSNQNVNI